MLAWVGVGWTFVGAILFSGAAICLRGEREREEAINMQYLMPGNFGVHFRSFNEGSFINLLIQIMLR